ncbi:MAG: hypothetical protein IIY04_06840, partial [Oscillospiraceae bacterium]|nr:hypothetical protein [Oscillospiraceae bacterium]
CLYLGTHCTVWGATSDDAAVCLTQQQAQEIGEQFDDFFPDVTTAFGSYWYDADEDGRVAIMCYDIGRNYGTSVSTYTAGYFYSVDMLGLDGRLNGIKFSNSPTNAIDCIHIDTYPLMGYGTPMSRIEDCFDTLVHEFQHMLNFSSLIRNGQRMYPTMPTYLNEAFSMAAEHLICGAGSNTDRITYFNSSKYIQGTALTYWGSTLSNYANSYLFGQYIRTRYGALTADDGSTLFHAVLDARQTDPYADCLSLIAYLLNTTEQALITDFWCACYLKEDSGNWGFQGERWANAISPQVAADFSSTYGIYNGGAKFYDLTDGFTPLSSSNVTFVALTDPIVEVPAEAPVLTELTAERLSLSEGKIAFTADRNGRLFYTLTSGEITDKSQLSHEIELTANAHTTLWVDTLYAPDQAPTFYYFTEAGGVQSDLQSIQIPPLDCHLSIFDAYTAELFVRSAPEGTAYLALYDAQTGQMLEVHEAAFNGANIYQMIYTTHDMTACKIKVFLLDENGTPMRAAYQP